MRGIYFLLFFKHYKKINSNKNKIIVHNIRDKYLLLINIKKNIKNLYRL